MVVNRPRLGATLNRPQPEAGAKDRRVGTRAVSCSGILRLAGLLAAAWVCFVAAGCATAERAGGAATQPVAHATPKRDPAVDFGFWREMVKVDNRPPSESQDFIDEFDESDFRRDFRIGVLEAEFPVRAGMTLDQPDEFLRSRESRDEAFDFYDSYNFGWELRRVVDGNGWIYFWVNGKALLHTEICVKNRRLRNVWVMYGNAEAVMPVYYRISGEGARCGPNQLYPREEKPKGGADDDE